MGFFDDHDSAAPTAAVASKPTEGGFFEKEDSVDRPSYLAQLATSKDYDPHATAAQAEPGSEPYETAFQVHQARQKLGINPNDPGFTAKAGEAGMGVVKFFAGAGAAAYNTAAQYADYGLAAIDDDPATAAATRADAAKHETMGMLSAQNAEDGITHTLKTVGKGARAVAGGEPMLSAPASPMEGEAVNPKWSHVLADSRNTMTRLEQVAAQREEAQGSGGLHFEGTRPGQDRLGLLTDAERQEYGAAKEKAAQITDRNNTLPDEAPLTAGQAQKRSLLSKMRREKGEPEMGGLSSAEIAALTPEQQEALKTTNQVPKVQPKTGYGKDYLDFGDKVAEVKRASGLAAGQVQDAGAVASTMQAFTGSKPSEMFASPKELAEQGAPLTDTDKFIAQASGAAADPTNIAFELIPHVPGVGATLKGAGRAMEWAGQAAPAILARYPRAVTVAGLTGLGAGLVTVAQHAPELLNHKTEALGLLAFAGALATLRPAGSFVRSAGRLAAGEALEESVGAIGMRGRQALAGSVGGAAIGGGIAAASGDDIEQGTLGGLAFGLASGAGASARPNMEAASRAALVRRGETLSTGNAFEPMHNEILSNFSKENRDAINALRGHLHDSTGADIILVSGQGFSEALGNGTIKAEGANGRFAPSDPFAMGGDGKTIYLNVDAIGSQAGAKSVAGHEIGHAVVDYLKNADRASQAMDLFKTIRDTLSGSDYDTFANSYREALASDAGVGKGGLEDVNGRIRDRADEVANEFTQREGREPSQDELIQALYADPASRAMHDELRQSTRGNDQIFDIGKDKGDHRLTEENLAETTRKILDGEDISHFALPKPVLEKLADAASRWLEARGLKPKVAEKPDLAFQGKSVAEATRQMRDLLYEQGARARTARQRVTDVASGKEEATVPERLQSIGAAIREIDRMAPDAVKPSDLAERDRLVREAQRLHRLESDRQGLSQPEPTPEAPLAGAIPTAAAEPAAPAAAAPGGNRADVESGLRALGYGARAARDTAAAAQGDTTEAMLADALGRLQPRRDPAAAPAPAAEPPAPEPAAPPAEAPQGLTGLDFTRTNGPDTQPDTQTEALADTGRATAVQEPPAPSVQDVPPAPRDSGIPETDQVELARASAPEGTAMRDTIDTLDANRGKVVWVRDYNSAAKEQQGFGEAERSGEIKKQSAKKRKGGEEGSYQNKPFIPTEIRVNAKGEAYVNGFDVDVMLSNLRHVTDFMRENGIENPLGSDKAIEDAIAAYNWNHNNGFDGSGLKPLSKPGPDFRFPDANQDAAPRPLDPDPAKARRIADMLNMAVNSKIADLKGAEASKATGLALENGNTSVLRGDANSLRADLEKAGFNTAENMSSRSAFYGRLSTDLVKGGVTTNPVADPGNKSVRPHGFDIDLQKAFGNGKPQFEAVTAGFMPSDTSIKSKTDYETQDPRTSRPTLITSNRIDPEVSKAISDRLAGQRSQYNESLKAASASGSDEGFAGLADALPRIEPGELGLRVSSRGIEPDPGNPKSAGLVRAGAGGESVTYTDGDVAYKVFFPQDSWSGEGIGIGIEGEMIAKSDGGWTMDYNTGTLKGLLDKLHVLSRIGGIPSEIVGLTEGGALIVKQPKYTGNRPAESPKTAVPAAHKRSQLMHSFELGKKFTVVDGEPFVVGDLTGSNHTIDNQGDFRVADAVVAPMPQELLDEHPGLKMQVALLKAGENTDRPLVAFMPNGQADGERQFRHWSNQPTLEEIDPAFQGTGYQGAEKKRQRAYPDRYEARSYIGFDGYQKENGLGPHEYTGKIDSSKLYDLSKDPDGLAPAARKGMQEGDWPGMDNARFITEMERQIKAKGYSGYYTNPEKTVAAIFDKLPVTKSLGGFMPSGGEGVDSMRDILKQYVPDFDKIGDDYFRIRPIDEGQAKKQNEIAKAYEALKVDNLSDPQVRKAYSALAEKLKDQFQALEKAGIQIEPWTDEGQPYANSKELQADMRDNKHLYYFGTDESTFGSSGNFSKDHPMLQDSGLTAADGTKMLNNDVLRAVHDAIAHGSYGVPFGPAGEEAAWRAHMATVDNPDARLALTTETRGQNSWVNFRDQFLGKSGLPLKKGEEGYMPPQDRPFADQKTDLLPREYALTGDPTVDAIMHGTAAEKVTFERNGETVEHYRAPDGKFTTPEPRDLSGFMPSQHPDAIKEAATKFSDGTMKTGRTHTDIIDSLPLSHYDEGMEHGFVTNSGEYLNREDAHKRALEMKQIDSKYNYGAGWKGKLESGFMPSGKKPAEGLQDLNFGSRFTPEALAQQNVKRRTSGVADKFPEAIAPVYKKEGSKFILDEDGKPSAEKIDYNLADTPLAKQAAKGVRGDDKRGAAVTKAYADKLVGEFDRIKDKPEIMAGSKWYELARTKIADHFGDDSLTFAQLLGATSARTPVAENFAQALEAYNLLKSGEYDGKGEKYLDLERKLENGEDLRFTETYSKKVGPKTTTIEPGTPVTPTNFKFFLDQQGVLPKKSNGKEYNANSLQVLRVIAGNWASKVGGPKTPQFASNLSGVASEGVKNPLGATVDVWAARNLHRLGHEGLTDKRWRIMPESETGVNDQDFALGQAAYEDAAKRLGMNPDSLQAVLWFAEKQVWEQRGWTRGAGAELSDFNVLLDKTVQRDGKKVIEKAPDPQADLFSFMPSSAQISAHQSGDTMHLDMMELPSGLRGKGKGREEYEKWEKNLPESVKKIRLLAADAGSGNSAGFWEKMGFDYAYADKQGDDTDFEMVKRLNRE